MLERAGLTLSREAKKELVDLVKKLEMPRPQGASGRKEARARSLLIGIKATDDPSHPPEPEKTK
jgi:hypothetical protein